MTQQARSNWHSKISPTFAARLNRLGSEQKVKAIVLLNVGSSHVSASAHVTRSERKALVEAWRKSAQSHLNDIDLILDRTGGQRLSKSPSALGSVDVETTPAGINALAKSRRVKAILEDQPISLAR